MRKTRPLHIPQRLAQAMLVMFLLGLTVLTTACGGDPRAQQSASQNKVQLDQLIQRAQQIGVPASTFSPVLKKEQQLSNSSAPFTLFNDQPDTNYYQKQANQYHELQMQMQLLIATTTDQFQLQAQNDMQVFQQALSRRSAQHIGNTQPFTDQLNNDQLMLTSAKYPKDYALVSHEAQKAILTLGLMGQTFGQLMAFKNTIGQMRQAHIDVTAMNTQFQSDEQAFNNATLARDFQSLDTVINAQYQLAVV